MITGKKRMYKHVILPEEMVTTDNLQALALRNTTNVVRQTDCILLSLA